MQFKMNVGTDYSTVKFDDSPIRPSVMEVLISHFERIGGVSIQNAANWKFPVFINSQVIEQVIHNTCFECGGLMKDSTAFKNQDVIENPNGLSMTAHVFKGAGEARQIKVRKCTVCGHSHT